MVDNNRNSEQIQRTLIHNTTNNNYTNYYYQHPHHNHDEEEDEEEIITKEQDRLLPIANVGRIMKQILPSSAKISKEAKETMQECASEFISFVTCEASDNCRKEKRKTVNGDDICRSLFSLGFDDYAGALKLFLARFRDQADAAAAASSAAVDANHLQINGGDQIRKDPFFFDLNGLN